MLKHLLKSQLPYCLELPWDSALCVGRKKYREKVEYSGPTKMGVSGED